MKMKFLFTSRGTKFEFGTVFRAILRTKCTILKRRQTRYKGDLELRLRLYFLEKKKKKKKKKKISTPTRIMQNYSDL